MTPSGTTAVTHPDLIKLAALKAILESIDDSDEDDARQAIRMVRALLGGGEKDGAGDKAEGK